jgi:CRISPR/Cas system CSM-associated protein Csm3 (group 7 of RAMP superfamily)
MPVLRDARSNKPLLPGTTLTGALRSALADRLAGYLNEEPPEVAALFGTRRGEDDGAQSPLIVFDSVGELPANGGVEIRDGVAIVAATGIADDHRKYDYEVLPAGTSFPVRVDLLLPAPAYRDGAPPPTEKSLLEALAAAVDSFADGSFGAKRSRGLGKVRAVWVAKRFDLSSARGWLDWILSDHVQPFDAIPDRSCIRDVLDAAAPEALRPLEFLGDARNRVVIDLDLRVAHDILIRSSGTEPGDPDVSHLRSGGTAILPGTSLAGVMRTHALRIARLVRADKNDAEVWVDRLFGPRFEDPPAAIKPHASRVRISESRLEEGHSHVQVRIAIDRFTQGVIPTALFDEQTDVGGRAIARLELRNPHHGELGLLLLVLKDLLGGFVPVGGTSSVGRGFLSGSATVTWHEGSASVSRSAMIRPGQQPSGDAAEQIDAAIRAFHQAGSLASPASGAETTSERRTRHDHD